jgi:hypothetical protein
MTTTFVRNDPGDYDVRWDGETVGAILRERGEWVLRLPFPYGGDTATTLTEAQGRAERYLEEMHRSRTAYARWLAETPATSFSAPAPTPPPQEEPMAQPAETVETAATAETAPTPEETRWASYVMNEQRHGREVSPEDRKHAGEIMGRARRASGRTGGGSKPKASPLVVAQAIKDIDVKVAEDQGINASREGEAVPAPAPEAAPEPQQAIGTPIAPEPPQTIATRNAPEAVPAPVRQEAPTSAGKAFEQAGARLIEDLDRALEAKRDEQAKLTERIDRTRNEIVALEQRRTTVQDAINVVNEAGR